MHSWIRLGLVALLLTVLSVTAAAAQETAGQGSPAPSTPAAATAPQSAAPVLPKDFDPCGGPQELLNKFGTTPCIVVRGEALLSANYTSAQINGNVLLGSIATVPIRALARIYPQPLVTVGLTSTTDVQIVPPTYARVDSPRFPQLASGATDIKVRVKQRVGFDIKRAVLTSIAFGVEFPTGSPDLRAAGPAYTADLIGSKAFPHHFSAIYDARLNDAADASQAAESNVDARTITLSWTVVGIYTSPGNLLVGAGAFVPPSGVVTPLLIVEQLVDRHVGVQLLYGGFGQGFVTGAQTDVPVVNTINARGSVNVVSAGLFFLFGRSGP